MSAGDTLTYVQEAAQHLEPDVRLTVVPAGVLVHWLTAGAIPGAKGTKLVPWHVLRNCDVNPITLAIESLIGPEPEEEPESEPEEDDRPEWLIAREEEEAAFGSW